MEHTNLPPAIGYIRVSTGRQANDGVSLDAQRARITAWAHATGYELVHIYDDAGMSGKRADNRPGLNAALTYACQHKAALVVYSLSRLARSTKDAINISERLDKAGADLVSLSERIDTTSAVGKMIFRLMAVLAEFERDQISERTTAALQFLKSNGKRVGAVPFGYDLDDDGKTLVPNSKEQEILEKMKWWRYQAKKSFARISAKLNEQSILSKSGRKWAPNVVRAILLREMA